MTRLYWICPRDVRKNRADAVRAMYDCAGFARLGVEVTLVTPHVRRPEYPVGRDQIWPQYGLRKTFRIVELPTFYSDARKPGSRLYELNVRLQKLTAAWLYALSLALVSLVRRGDRVFVLHCQAAGLPFLLLSHIPLLRWKSFSVSGGWLGPRRGERLHLRGAAGVLAGNEYMRDRMLEHYGLPEDRVFLQWPYTYLELLEEDGDGPSLPPSGNVVTYVGKIGYPPHREIDLLIETAQLLPDCQFVFVGGNGKSERSYDAHCRELGIGNTTWLGFQPLPALLPLARRSDVLVSYYSRTDRLAENSRIPAKFALYRSAGKPVVAADLPAMRAVLGEDEAWFVPPDRPEELARTLESIFADPEEARRRGARALERAAESSTTRYCADVLEFMARTPRALPLWFALRPT